MILHFPGFPGKKCGKVGRASLPGARKCPVQRSCPKGTEAKPRGTSCRIYFREQKNKRWHLYSYNSNFNIRIGRCH